MSSKTPEVAAFDTPEHQPEQQPAQGNGQPMIDPSLMEIATQSAVAGQQSPKVDAAPSHQEAPETHDERLHTASADDRDFLFSEPHTLGITESIAQAPDPKPGDFMPPRLGEDEGIDLEALESQVDDDMPGSPTAKLMRAIAPPLALQSQPIWPAVSLVLDKISIAQLASTHLAKCHIPTATSKCHTQRLDMDLMLTISFADDSLRQTRVSICLLVSFTSLFKMDAWMDANCV